MKGYVILSKDNGVKLIQECRDTINSFTPTHITTSKRIGVKGLFGKKTTIRVYDKTPTWFSLNGVNWKPILLGKLDELEGMLNRGDDINLSLTCYNELCKLAKNDSSSWNTNPIFIINY